MILGNRIGGTDGSRVTIANSDDLKAVSHGMPYVVFRLFILYWEMVCVRV